MRLAIAFFFSISAALVVLPALAVPGDKEAARGLNAARRGFCAGAIPLLESAEEQRHRPNSAVALADCYWKRGDLLQAAEVYRAVAQEKKQPGYTARDVAAIASAKKKTAQTVARIPTLVIKVAEPYRGLVVEIDGERVEDPSKPQQFNPRARIMVVVRADGHQTLTQRVVLEEKERRTLSVRLRPQVGAAKPAAPKPRDEKPLAKQTPEPKPAPSPRGARTTWLGAGYQGFVIPGFMFRLFGEGGRNIIVPGGDVALTKKLGDLDLVFSIAYASFGVGETPFKASGHPDTDYEIIESDLQALQASARVVWDVPLDAQKTVSFRVGAGIGVGWTFLGDLYRTQSYPGGGVAGDQRTFVPGNPNTYVKCRGPNNPAGTFRYCNQLDYDADHYPGYVEPDWFTQPRGKPRGVRPLIYPWFVLPELGLSYRASDDMVIDLRVGASVTGVLTGLGVRFAL